MNDRDLSLKEPISATLIHDIINKSDLDNPVELRNVAMYLVSMCLELEEVIFPLKKASWLLRF